MLNQMKKTVNTTRTENGAMTYSTSGSDCLDLFALLGGMRHQTDDEIIRRFEHAYIEDADLAMKILFYGRDVRGGLGERRIFRVIARHLALYRSESIRRNISYFSEYGRWDDLLTLMGTPCEDDAVGVIKTQLDADLASLEKGEEVSLLAKWLPSVNASSKETKYLANRLAAKIKMRPSEYRKMLSRLRAAEHIIENNLRTRDYSFDYEKQTSLSMFKYRQAFFRNDNERYTNYLGMVQRGEAKLHTGTLMPYEIVRSVFQAYDRLAPMTGEERRALDVTWNALDDFEGDKNALCVIDGSGSMYCPGNPMPATVAISLGIYFAERNKGAFKNHFITFSREPRLIEIKGEDIYDKVAYCSTYNEIANTNVQKVFELILSSALKGNVPQNEMPETIYIISDMEFDWCTEDADMTNFEYAKKLYEENGYKLPKVVFWNVASRNKQVPVTENEEGVALVSGCTPRIFSMVMEDRMSPYEFMMDVLSSERYEKIAA